eukprot:3102549-Amphidinium_carterae.1
MAWQNIKAVQEMINSYKAMEALGSKLPFGRRGGPQLTQQQVQPGSKKWSAQTRSGWNCPKCTY